MSFRPPRYSPLANRVFDRVFLPRMRGRLHGLRFGGLPETLAPGGRLLYVANHTSWWDGFVLRELHRILRPGAPFHPVMLERELDRRPFLRWLGPVGIRTGSTASIRSLLRWAGDLTGEGGGRSAPAVAFFPQGRIWPSTRRPLGFVPGVEALVRALEPVTVLPLGLHVEPGNDPSPTVYVQCGAPCRWTDLGSVRALEARVEGALDGLLDFVHRHGEDAPDRWLEEVEGGRGWPPARVNGRRATERG